MSQGLPFAGLLVWQGWQVKGLVLGLLLATSITASVFVTTIVRVDWEKESRAAVERANRYKMEAEAQHDNDQQRRDEVDDEVTLTAIGAGKGGKDWYMGQEEQKEQKSNEAGATTAPLSPVREYHSVAVDEEKKEPPRPLEHI